MLLTFLLAVTTLVSGWGVVARNLWSLQYYHVRSGEVRQAEVLTRTPEGHARAALWLAMDALAEGDPERSVFLLEGTAFAQRSGGQVILGEALAAQGDLEGAIRYWSEAGYSDGLLALAQSARAREEYQLAATAYKAAWQLDPVAVTSPYTNFLLNEYQDPDLAIQVLQDTINLPLKTPQRTDWLIVLGDLLREKERLDEAERIYLKALEEQPDLIAAHLGLGWVYAADATRHELAEKAFHRAIAIDPDHAEANFALGRFSALQDDLLSAEKWVATAISLDPDNCWWILYLGTLYSEEGDFVQAITEFERTIACDETWSPGYYEVAWMYAITDKPERATKAIETAIQLSSLPNEWYFVRAGRIYEMYDELEKAIQMFSQALEINPENEPAYWELQRLSVP